MTERVVVPFGARYLVLDAATFRDALTAGDAYIATAPVASDEPELVDAKEIARLFTMKESAVLRMARDGVIPVQKIGRLVRFDVSAVRVALAKR